MGSTFQKGDSYEKKVYELIRKLVENDDFFIPGKRSQVFRKKGYHSMARNAEIIFDISIETSINNTSPYSLLTLIECKNLNRKVSVDDVSLFADYISQVGKHNAKGVIITKIGFQQGAYQTAVRYGIALMRLTGDDVMEWISYRKPKFITGLSLAELEAAFTGDKLEGRSLVASMDGHPLYNLSDILIELKVIDFYVHKERFIKIPFVTEDRIKKIIQRLRPYDVYEEDKLNIERLYAVLKEKYEMDFDFDKDLKENVLGKIEFDPLKISISRSLKSDLNRWRFTAAHEIGHLILHSPLIKFSIDSKSDTESTLWSDSTIADATVRQMEYQANLFARHLLLPGQAVSGIVSRYFSEHSIQKGFLYLDDQPVNRNLVFTLLNTISDRFQVSVEAAKVRLKTMGLLKDATYTSIRSVLKKNKYL